MSDKNDSKYGRETRCLVESKIWNERLELYLWEIDSNERKHRVFTKDGMVEVEDGGNFPPTVMLTATVAQELMDSLWRSGVRPTEGAGTAGSMAAVQAHLKDMRALVSHFSKTEFK